MLILVLPNITKALEIYFHTTPAADFADIKFHWFVFLSVFWPTFDSSSHSFSPQQCDCSSKSDLGNCKNSFGESRLFQKRLGSCNWSNHNLTSWPPFIEIIRLWIEIQQFETKLLQCGVLHLKCTTRLSYWLVWLQQLDL